MTFSVFVKALKCFYGKNATNGTFVLELIDESLEDVSKKDEEQVLENYGCLSYNPVRSEETARKYFDGSRKISRQNFAIIEKHFERNKFIDFLETYILTTDDSFRHLVLKLKESGIDCDENNVEETCADIFDEIIASADKEYKKSSELTLVRDEEQETFLDFTYTILQKAIEKSDWSFQSPKHKLFKHELYELSQEDTEERFDIAIENYNGENTEPSLKVLIKCKKSNSPLTKDELVLFMSKVLQVPGICKPVFITNISFEQDAFDYAKRMGIGILRIFDEDKIHWLAPRTMNEPVTYTDYEKCEQEIQKAVMQKDYEILNNFAVGHFQGFYANVSEFLGVLLGQNYYSNISNAELYETSISHSNQEAMPFIGNDDLKEIARQIRFEIYGEDERNIFSVNIGDLIAYLRNKFGFSVGFPIGEPTYTFPQKIHGLVDYANRSIQIYGIETADLHLLKFSIAHEISHLVLHKPLLEKGKDSFYYFYQSTNESKRIEIQANKLANYIILDDYKFKMEFMKLVSEYHLTLKNGHYLYLDYQKCNITMFMQVTGKLMAIFDISREQIKYKLIELGWLEVPNKNTFAVGHIAV